jgi:hypothetical protein
MTVATGLAAWVGLSTAVVAASSYPYISWQDEFDGTAIDPGRWTYDIGTGSQYGLDGWGNNELQFYQPQNTFLHDGHMLIEARRESVGGRNFTSSRIITRGRREFRYGRIDIRAALPEGQGIWPALWMLGRNINQIGWPASMRDIDAGLTTLQADPGTPRTSLGALSTVTLSEYGAFYVSPSGSFTFKDRNTAASSVAGIPVDFNDNGTDISYFNALWRLDDTLVYNAASITRTGGTTQLAINQPSIDKYFTHSYNQQGLLMQTDADALDYAEAYVASHAETTVRCDAITLDLYTDNYNAGIIAALDLDFFDPITIVTTQPGGSTLDKTLQVFGVAMNITPGSWKATFTTLEPIIEGFILDFSELDTGVLSY